MDADSLLAAVEQAPDIESLRELWKQAADLTDDDCPPCAPSSTAASQT
ncbi:hypothetical protein GS498_25560 [Rhodococcus hoagii]|nr:hypothetical protein [Prescottella equi]